MPVTAFDPYDLEFLLARNNLVQLTMSCRPRLVVVCTYLQGPFQDDKVVHLSSVMPVPSSDHSRMTERKVGLKYGIITKQVFPILSHNLSEEASFIDAFPEIDDPNAR